MLVFSLFVLLQDMSSLPTSENSSSTLPFFTSGKHLIKKTLRLNWSDQLVRLSAASKVIVITPFYELPVSTTKETWQLANPGCVRHRWESSLYGLIDWEENSLNSVFHLSQSKSKLSSPLGCPPVGEGIASAALDSLLQPNKCPVAQHSSNRSSHWQLSSRKPQCHMYQVLSPPHAKKYSNPWFS